MIMHMHGTGTIQGRVYLVQFKPDSVGTIQEQGESKEIWCIQNVYPSLPFLLHHVLSIRTNNYAQFFDWSFAGISIVCQILS